MKTLVISAVIAGTTLFGAAVTVRAADAPAQLRGSDTLFGAITDAVNQSGLQSEIQYLGGGSGLGEAGLRAGTQGIAIELRIARPGIVEAAKPDPFDRHDRREIEQQRPKHAQFRECHLASPRLRGTLAKPGSS